MPGAIDRLVERSSVTYYDLVLAVIPSVFVVAVLVGAVFSVPAETAITGASVAAALALADALFVNPPVARK